MHVNPKYGAEPGRMLYTCLGPMRALPANVGGRDAAYVLDGLPYHESDPAIQETCTDTAGFTDHLLALQHLLGYRFAPRIRNKATPASTRPPTGWSIRCWHR